MAGQGGQRGQGGQPSKAACSQPACTKVEDLQSTQYSDVLISAWQVSRPWQDREVSTGRVARCVRPLAVRRHALKSRTCTAKAGSTQPRSTGGGRSRACGRTVQSVTASRLTTFRTKTKIPVPMQASSSWYGFTGCPPTLSPVRASRWSTWSSPKPQVGSGSTCSSSSRGQASARQHSRRSAVAAVNTPPAVQREQQKPDVRVHCEGGRVCVYVGFGGGGGKAGVRLGEACLQERVVGRGA
jgi:hypothetical protein